MGIQQTERFASGLLLLSALTAAGCGLLAAANNGDGDQLGCGNGRCDANETQANCPADCDAPAGRPCTIAGDECEEDEQCVNNTCVPDGDNGVVVCGDDVCDPGETLLSCPVDCIDDGQNVCGNGQCDPGETILSCPIDCLDDNGQSICGNDQCETGETLLNCPADCLDDGDGDGDPCTPACITAAQCDDGNDCTTDACVPASAPCGAASVCRNSQIGCPFGQRCVGGRCQEEELCFQNSDCPIGQNCVAGVCTVVP